MELKNIYTNVTLKGNWIGPCSVDFLRLGDPLVVWYDGGNDVFMQYECHKGLELLSVSDIAFDE